MRGVARLADLAHAETFLGFGEHHGRPALVLARGLERGMQLTKVVTAPAQRIDLLRAHVCNQRLQLRVLVEEMAAVIRTVIGPQILVLAIHHPGEVA